MAQRVKRLPAVETWVRSLGWEAPLEKEMAAHSRVLAWKIPWTEEPGGLQTVGLENHLTGTEFQFYSNGVLEVSCNDVAHLILLFP